jgi:hypothetical protein
VLSAEIGLDGGVEGGGVQVPCGYPVDSHA